MADLRITALILDFGGVLARAQSAGAVATLAALGRLPQEEFLARYWQHRRAYDDGLPVRRYWEQVLAPDAVDEATLSRLIEADTASWIDFRDAVWQTAATFRQTGGRTAILSNGVPEIIGAIRRQRDLDAYFDEVIVSCEVGCSKPDPAIYRLCLERLGVAAQNALFVDDLPANLEGAAALGIQTLHFRGDEDVPALRRRLAG